MALAEIAKGVTTGIVSPIASVFNKRTERKQAKETLAAKATLAKLEGNTALERTDAEWEIHHLQTQERTWKDEWVTVLITSPLALIILGAVYGTFTEDMRMLEAVKLALEELSAAGVPMGELMIAVVLAAVGLKIWRQA